jgi:hypothetical protein
MPTVMPNLASSDLRSRASLALLCATALGLVSAASACSSPSDPAVGDDAASPVDTGLPGTDSATDTPAPAPGLTIKSVTAQNVGRSGNILQIVVQGSDAKKQTTSAVLRFLDASDTPMVALDTNFDGKPDATEKRFRWDPSTLGQAAFTGTLRLPRIFGPTSSITKVAVALEDAAGGRSPFVTAPITLQALRALGEACDAKEIADRCAPHLSCAGTPTVCTAGVAPSLSKAVYYGGASPRMVFLGTDPDEDVKEIVIEFLDKTGSPKAIDLLNDGDLVTSFATSAAQSMGDPSFFVEIEPILGFDTFVPQIAATPGDSLLHKGVRLTAMAGPVPVRTLGQSCDYHDFDVCTSGTVCSPGFATTTNTCQNGSQLRTTACGAAPVLDPAKGITKAFGVAQGPSLWDSPTGCEPHNAAGRPEGLVSLHLAKAAATLTISTAMPETDFDTVVYLLPGCAGVSSAALGCNDDTVGYASVLTLKNVAAGDYVIVVDAVQRDAGHFGLFVEVK